MSYSVEYLLDDGWSIVVRRTCGRSCRRSPPAPHSIHGGDSVGHRACQGGCPSVTVAYRVGFRCVWDAAVKESASRAHMNGDASIATVASTVTHFNVMGSSAKTSRELVSHHHVL